MEKHIGPKFTALTQVKKKIQPSKLRRRFACKRSISLATVRLSVLGRKVIHHLNTALGFLSPFKLLFTHKMQTALRLLSAFISKVPSLPFI